MTLHVAGCLIVCALSADEVAARDWRWYPKREYPDANALRPDLEGTRDDRGQSGSSELEEMRQWLYRRDVERRARGFTLPDTVEQLELPGGDRERSVPGSWGRSGPSSVPISEFDAGLPEERVRDVLSPDFPRGGIADNDDGFAPAVGDGAVKRPAGRRSKWGQPRRGSKAARGTRSHPSGAPRKSRGGHRRRR